MDCDPPFRASLVGLPSPAAGPCWSPDELAPPVPRGAGGRWGRTRMAELTCGHGTQWPPDERDRVGRGSHTLWALSQRGPRPAAGPWAPLTRAPLLPLGMERTRGAPVSCYSCPLPGRPVTLPCLLTTLAPPSTPSRGTRRAEVIVVPSDPSRPPPGATSGAGGLDDKPGRPAGGHEAGAG